MTEAEWQTCEDPRPMLEFLRGRVSARKLRLFAVGYCRSVWTTLVDERSRQAVETAERFADGLAGKSELRAAHRMATEATRALGGDDCRNAQVARMTSARQLLVLEVANSRAAWDPVLRWDRRFAHKSRLIRELIGNPYHPAAVSEAWLAWNDGTVRKMAQALYDERAFDRLPLLADALEDAGCDNADILAHCRSGGEHVRGCWVVDLLLDKK